ncbi:MAG: hypothetical protein IKZ07_02510 [Akkermansia sp.]|nr:hypothetical protein [Akkermansia sp.]
MIDKLTAKKIMLHPAAVVAILYTLTNVVYWGWLSESGIMPVIGEIFALFLPVV